MQLTQHLIDRLRTETKYLHARSTTIAVPLFQMHLVLDAAEQYLNTKHQTPNSNFQNDGKQTNDERIT